VGQLLANGFGNTLPVDRSYRHLPGISIQMKAKGKGLCKNDVVIDSEIQSRIKRTLTDNITTGYKEELIEKIKRI